MIPLPRLAAGAFAATSLAASFLLLSAVPRMVVPVVAAHGAPFDVFEAEVQACRSRGGRSDAQCDAEVEGKALVRDAELALAAPSPLPGRAPQARGE